MARICEHKFEYEDPKHPGYSATEMDLFPAVGGWRESYSVRKNMAEDEYEIFNFKHDDAYSDAAVAFSGDLDEVIREANTIEEMETGSGSFEYAHSPGLYDGCPADSWLEL